MTAENPHRGTSPSSLGGTDSDALRCNTLLQNSGVQSKTHTGKAVENMLFSDKNLRTTGSMKSNEIVGNHYGTAIYRTRQ